MLVGEHITSFLVGKNGIVLLEWKRLKTKWKKNGKIHFIIFVG